VVMDDHVVVATADADDDDDDDSDDDMSPFSLMVDNALNCLYKSDLKRQGGADGGSTGWTSWVEEKSAFQLEQVMNRVVLSSPIGVNEMVVDESDDESLKYIKWFKNSPVPMIVELSSEFREVAAQILERYPKILQEMKIADNSDVLARLGCRLIVLPSGMELDQPLITSPGGMAYGKLLYGGAKRFRYLRSARKGVPTRITGESTSMKVTEKDNPRSWVQFGGPERNYLALDMGPAAIVEVYIFSKDFKLPLLSDDKESKHMSISQLNWDPTEIFQIFDENDFNDNSASRGVQIDKELVDIGNDRNAFFQSRISTQVQGLDDQISTIVRRVLDGRVIAGNLMIDESGQKADEASTREAKTLAALGLTPVRGLLLHGSPGCGKTLLAREIARLLQSNDVKIVSAPELLEKWMGSTEKLIRNLFRDAEEELRACGGDPTKSSLHVIVIDEIDAVFRKRSSASDSGEVTRASAVNQILTKLDGINSLGNVLLIGMTNRRELLDEALLRPGRLEVQIEVPKPTREARRQIMKLHFGPLRKQGRLSAPLCRAIDGTDVGKDFESKYNFLSRIRKTLLSSKVSRINDLAADRFTGGFSGADIAGLVRCAGSRALSRARTDGGGVESLIVTLSDVVDALDEVKVKA